MFWKPRDRGDWNRWCAWWPVQLIDGRKAWLEPVWCRVALCVNGCQVWQYTTEVDREDDAEIELWERHCNGRTTMKAELFEDKVEPGVYRVEAFDDDGGCEVAIFSGPRALERATAFANCGFYESGGKDTEPPHHP